MPDTLDYRSITAMLRTAAERLKQNRAHLSELDSATGDGDHGTAVSKVADAITTTIDKDGGDDVKKLLKDVAWAAMSTDAGSTSPLYGSFLLGISEAVPEDGPIDCAAYAAMLESGVTKLRKNTRAEPGNKTMLDALLPAVAAVRAAADGGKSLGEALADGAGAAVDGAEATKDMKATFGRAKNIGERSIGHVDPGAASMSILFTGLKEGLHNG